MLDLADEHRLRAAEVQQEFVADTVLDTDAHAVRRGGIVGVQHLPVHAIHEIETLVLSAHVDVIAKHAVQEKLHAHTRGEVE